MRDRTNCFKVFNFFPISKIVYDDFHISRRSTVFFECLSINFDDISPVTGRGTEL